MTGREASIFACLADTVVAPDRALPPIAETDTVGAFARYLARSPSLNRTMLRAAVLGLEVGPWMLGFGARMRQLSPSRRAAYLDRLERGRLEPLAKALRGLAQFSYYGDDHVMRQLGYDPDARVGRGQALRRAEGRW